MALDIVSRRMPRQKPGRSKQNYATPRPFVRAVESLLGIDAFDHDFAAEPSTAVCPSYWTKKQNAFHQRWDVPGWGWLNPPFANIAPWATQCRVRGSKGGRIALLVPASVGSNWFYNDVASRAFVLFLNGRLSFDGIGPYPKDCMLCLFGPDYAPGYDVWNWRQ